jgi:hypothetical protein
MPGRRAVGDEVLDVVAKELTLTADVARAALACS